MPGESCIEPRDGNVKFAAIQLRECMVNRITESARRIQLLHTTSFLLTQRFRYWNNDYSRHDVSTFPIDETVCTTP